MPKLFISHGSLLRDRTMAEDFKTSLVAAGMAAESIKSEVDGLEALRTASVIVFIATPDSVTDQARMTTLRLAAGYSPVLIAIDPADTSSSGGAFVSANLVNIEHEPPYPLGCPELVQRCVEALQGNASLAPRIFLSYSRSDSARAHKLVGDLRARGLRVFLDTAVLAPAADWLERLRDFITDADAVIFALSPSALASKICGVEVTHAVETGTAILPVMIVEPTLEQLAGAPTALRSHNYIFARTEEEWPRAITEIRFWAFRDSAWRRAHAVLVGDALSWRSAEPAKKNDLLLRGRILDEAFIVLRDRPKGGPETPDVVFEYLNAGRISESLLRTERSQILQRAFVAPIRKPADLRSSVLPTHVGLAPERALRRLAAAAVLSDDPELSLDDATQEPNRAALWRAGAWSAQYLPVAVASGHKRIALEIAFGAQGFDTGCGREDPAIVTFLAEMDRIDSDILESHFGEKGFLVLFRDGRDEVTLWSSLTKSFVAISGEASITAFSVDGTKLALGRRGDKVEVWNVSRDGTAQIIRQFRDPHAAAVALNADGSIIAIGSRSGTMRLWDLRNGKRITTLRGRKSRIDHIAFSTSGSTLATALADATVRLWDVAASRCTMVLKGHESNAESVGFDRDETRVFATAHDGTTRLWDVKTGVCLADFGGEKSNTVVLAGFSPQATLQISGDGTRIFTSPRKLWSSDKARVWDTAYSLEIASFEGSDPVAFSADGTKLAGFRDGAVRIWDIDTGRETLSLVSGETYLSSMSFSTDGTRVVTASGDKVFKVWSAEDGSLLTKIDAADDPSLAVLGHSMAAFSPDGSRIVGSTGTKTGVWDSRTGELLFTLGGNEHIRVSNAQFSRDGATIMIAQGGKIQLWDAAAKKLKLEFWADVTDASLSHDGRRVVATEDDDFGGRAGIQIWDAATGESILEIPGHIKGEFSPDGVFLLTQGTDGAAHVLDAATGATLLMLKDGSGHVGTASFSLDGTMIATSAWKGRIRLWDVRRLAAFDGDRGVYVAAALDCGVGMRSSDEIDDLLMQSAPDDLHMAYKNLLISHRTGSLAPEARAAAAAEIERKMALTSQRLRAKLDRRCYTLRER